MRDFFDAFQAAPEKTPHQFDEAVDKNHGRLEVRRCYVFDQLDCLHAPERWLDLRSFAVIRHFALNLIRYAPINRKGGLKAQRLRAASSFVYREELLGLL